MGGLASIVACLSAATGFIISNVIRTAFLAIGGVFGIIGGVLLIGYAINKLGEKRIRKNVND
jgi:hypothetical protein